MTNFRTPSTMTAVKTKYFAIMLFAVCTTLAILFAHQKGSVPMDSLYPPAPRHPHKLDIHGDARNDEYFWMRERDTPPVMEYLRQENRRSNEALQPVKDLEQTLYKEMRARIKEDDSSVPVRDGEYLYYSRVQAGQEYAVHCRKKDTLEAREEVLFDENAMAKGHSYFSVGEADHSPNHELYAFAVDTVGRRIHTLQFKNLKTGTILPDKIEGVTANFVWAADNKTVFYSRQDPETLRSYQIYRYEIGGKSELVYEEKDTTYNVWVEGSKRNEMIFMVVSKRDSTEWRYLDSRDPKGTWHVFLPRESNHEYSIDDAGDRFYILTNWKAKNFRLMEAPYTARDKNQWKEIIPNSDKIYIEGIDVYSKNVVIGERENGLTQIRVFNRQNAQSHLLKFPDPAYEVSPVGLPEYDSPNLRFTYESLVQPPSVYDEEFSGGKRELRKVREVPTYNSSRYESKRIWAKAKDGTMVPMSLVHKKGIALDGSNPTLLYGYGSYGLTNDVAFRGSIFSLIDRGFVFALGHIRGGSEMGREWYEKGRLKYKMNTFTDFIACAEKLIEDKYTSSQHLHIMGGSAGGLLMGAVINLRPDLFKGVVAAVPFVDVLTTMLDESIPLTTGEYNEWGDPRIKDQYEVMRTYSPYDNIEAKNYPNMLVTTGYHDSQVQYWEPAKWVARLRERKTDNNLLLLYTELNAGHSGASGRFEALKLLAKEYAFLLMLEGKRE